MIILAILLNFLAPHPTVAKEVAVNFTFKRMIPGKPTLKYYYYDITINNPTKETKYVILPRWFNEQLTTDGKIWGAQFDWYLEIKAATLFTDAGRFTIFTLAPKQKISIPDFTIESFDETITTKKMVEYQYGMCNIVMVGTHKLDDFMKSEEVHDDNLPFSPQKLSSKKVNITVQ